MSGKWIGLFSYNDQPESLSPEASGQFELHLRCFDGSFDGTCIDTDLKEILHEEITIHGFTERDMISFIKKYPSRYITTKKGELVIDNGQDGHEVEYTGFYDKDSKCFKGVWQINQDISSSSSHQIIRKGAWVFYREGDTPLELNLQDQDYLKYWKKKIYPWIKLNLAEKEPSDLVLDHSDSPVIRTWNADLIILYVIDTGSHFEIIQNRKLPADLTLNELHALAIENMNRDIHYEIRDTNFGGFMITAGGNHEAGLVCLPLLWQSLSEEFNDDLVVSIPAKDMLLFVPAKNNDEIIAMKRTSEKILTSGERILSGHLFYYDRMKKEWNIYKEIE